jgi:hypothetical protein
MDPAPLPEPPRAPTGVAPGPATEPPGRTAPPDRVAGFLIIFVAFCAALIISWKASEAVRPNVARPPAPPTTEGLAGYPDQLDPVVALPAARALSERDQLRRMIVTGVGPGGTVDLSQPRAQIRYEFDSAAGEGPEPPRPAGTVPRQGRYCGRRSVRIEREGMVAEADQPTATCRSLGDPLPEPRCTLGALWQRALEKRPDATGLATVEYFRAHGGPAWRFSLSDPPLSFTLFGDCDQELEGKDARPLAPRSSER